MEFGRRQGCFWRCRGRRLCCGSATSVIIFEELVMPRVDVQRFIEDGFVKIDGAFPPELAAAGREILWHDTGCDPHDPTTWTRPVIRLFDYPQEPFRQAANTEVLHRAFDDLVGLGRWLPRTSLGTFPIRFPSPDDPGDAGWH